MKTQWTKVGPIKEAFQMWRQVVITHRQELKFSIERKFYEMSLQGVEDDLMSLQKEFEGALFSTRCVLFSPSLLRSYVGVCCCLGGLG